MDPVTRRSFLAQGSAVAAGAAGVAALGVHMAPSAGADERPLTDDEVLAAAGPMLLRVTDAAAGEVELLIADRSVVFTDKSLVAKVLRASR
jgi:hypothetical protein